MDEDNQIWILTADETGSPPPAGGARGGDDTGGGFGARVASAVVRRISMSADDLRDQMTSLINVVDHVFDQTVASGNLKLDEVELSVDISTEGKLSIVAAGATVAGRGAVKLLFKRPSSQT